MVAGRKRVVAVVLSNVTVVARVVLLLDRSLRHTSLTNVQPKRRGIDVAVTPEKEGREDGLGKKVEHTVEDSLAVSRDDVAALAETP